MEIRIKIAELKEWTFAWKGNNITISQVWLVDDDWKHIRAIPLTQDVVNTLKQSPIQVEWDWEKVSPKVNLFQ